MVLDLGYWLVNKNKSWDSGLPRKARVISHDLDGLNVTSHRFAHSSIIFRFAYKISSFLAELLYYVNHIIVCKETDSRC